MLLPCRLLMAGNSGPSGGGKPGPERRHPRLRARLCLWHVRPRAARPFGVSRHTLWRSLERGHLGRFLPRAVTGAVGDNPRALDGATKELVATAQRQRKLLGR